MADYPKWQFDWKAEQRKAFARLKPYYEKILRLTKGDVDLAKRIIEADYKAGMRESKTDYEIQARRYAVEFPEETEALWTALNRRGVAGAIGGGLPTGGLAGKEAKRLEEKQAIRQEAIERALEQKKFRLEKGKELRTAGEELGLKRETQRMGREHEREAESVAGIRMGIEQAKYGARVGEWQAEENRRAREAAARGFMSGGGGASLVNPYPGMMADTRLQQLHKMDRNPVQETEYQRLRRGG